jgi:hypothetical protein
MLKGLLMTLRLLWLIVLITGALYYFHVAVPLNVHMYLGFAIGAILIVLGVLGLNRATGLAILTILIAVLLPVIGILQLKHLTMPDLPYIQITHVIIGIAAIGIAEILGKRLKTA